MSNAVVERLTLLRCIPDVQGLNLGPEIGHPD
jgi:hypothetical protein